MPKSYRFDFLVSASYNIGIDDNLISFSRIGKIMGPSQYQKLYDYKPVSVL